MSGCVTQERKRVFNWYYKTTRWDPSTHALVIIEFYSFFFTCFVPAAHPRSAEAACYKSCVAYPLNRFTSDCNFQGLEI
jgi:hypothetical protein